MTTYILGAGASRHAGYPLTCELGRCLHDWAIANHSAWSGFIQEAFELYGGLENLERVLTDLHERPEGSPAANLSRMHCGNMIGAFSVVIPELFNDLRKNVSAARDLYGELCRNSVLPGDTILTFNYDLSCERALRRAGLWEVGDGYGFDLGIESIPRSKVKILKLHGSTNWLGILFGGNMGFSQASSVYDGRPAVYGGREFTFLGYGEKIRDPLTTNITRTGASSGLILPTLQKNFFHQTSFGREWEPFWDYIWGQAGEALLTSEKIVIVGYSMPLADERARELILKRTNPNADVRVFSGSDSDSICRAFHECEHKNVMSAGNGYFEDFLGIVLSEQPLSAGRNGYA